MSLKEHWKQRWYIFFKFFNICTGFSKILSFRETMSIKLFECDPGD